MNNYQWYPGHMAKALKTMREDVKSIDVLLELVDARAPESTRNPNIADLSKGKIHILILNKRDMADDSVTKRWMEYYKAKKINAIAIDAKKKEDINRINALVDKLVDEKYSGADTRLAKAVEAAGGKLSERSIKIMVTGIPNVGKSTFINSFAGKAGTKTGNRPGVTKGKQWIRIRKGRELLDTPGVLYVKPLSQESGMRLAFIGSLNDNNLNIDELALDLVKWIIPAYPGSIINRYEVPEEEPLETMEAIGERRGALKRGGIIDYEKTAGIIMDDFRNGRLGEMSLERPE